MGFLVTLIVILIGAIVLITFTHRATTRSRTYAAITSCKAALAIAVANPVDWIVKTQPCKNIFPINTNIKTNNKEEIIKKFVKDIELFAEMAPTEDHREKLTPYIPSVTLEKKLSPSGKFKRICYPLEYIDVSTREKIEKEELLNYMKTKVGVNGMVYIDEISLDGYSLGEELFDDIEKGQYIILLTKEGYGGGIGPSFTDWQYKYYIIKAEKYDRLCSK